MTPPESAQAPLPYKKEDFVSGQDVRWCPGCGDYSILSTMQRTLAQFRTPRENHVFISGIGCSSRFPYYMNNYGFHTIHGRAPAIATGLKCARPDLTVWVVTGDGDGLSIGGNHLIHSMRRNVNINILLVNNRIYGLTKGQYSPTSEVGKVTKSTPQGSIDYPINPLCIAIAAEATFIARTVDTDPRHMGMVLSRALEHKGVAFVEIYQNCIIFNKDAFQSITGREQRDERAIYLEDGKPLIFGKNKDKGIALKNFDMEIVNLKKNPARKKDLLVHQEKEAQPNYAYLLTQMEYPELPVPFGVFRCIEKPTYEELLENQVRVMTEKKGEGKLKDMLYTQDVWSVGKKLAPKEKDEVKKSATTTKCPHCGHMSIMGSDRCESCGHSLTETSIPQPGKERLQRIIMTEPVTQFLSKEGPIFVDPEDSIESVIEKMQMDKAWGCVLVRDPQGKLLGIVSRRDILLRAAGVIKDLAGTPIKQIMTIDPETLGKDATLAFALHKMSIGRFRHVPIVDEDKPIGVVSIKDVLDYLAKKK